MVITKQKPICLCFVKLLKTSLIVNRNFDNDLNSIIEKLCELL